MASGGQRNTKKSSGRSGNTRKTSGSSAKTGKNTSGTGKRAKEAARKNQLKDEILVLIAFACAIILVLSNFNLAGSVGESIKWFMFGLFGVIEYIFPFVLVGTLLFLVSNRNLIGVARVKTASIYVLMLLLAGAWQRISDNPVDSSPLETFFTYSAKHESGGGLFGGMLCRLLSPLGFFGGLVIIFILAILCIVLITEKSFISGVRNVKESSSRMMHAAKQDYDIYREHSNEKLQQETEDEEGYETEEEYLLRRKQEKENRLQEKMARREQQQAAKRDRQEEKRRARMNNKALGVTNDTTLLKESQEQQADSINIHEITVDTNRYDEYSDDIYDPAEKMSSTSSVHQMDEQNSYLHEPASIESVWGNNVAEAADTMDVVETAAELVAVEPRRTEMMEPATATASIATVTTATTTKAENANKETNISQNATKIKEHSSQNDMEYKFPPLSLLKKNTTKGAGGQERENRATAIQLQQTLQNFGVKVTITDISCGPSVTRYELQPEQGVKVSKIVSLSDDIKLNLAAADIRIEAPIPGKAAIGIEVPNKEAGSVTLRELLEAESFQNHPSPISFAVGKDIAGKTIVADIAKMPHLLIAGATGSGKSVCINTIIMSMIYKADPEDVKLIMVDPKVVELSVYNGIPHLMIPVVTDPKKASGALNWAVAEMTDRYKKFADMHVRDLKGYNAKVAKMEAVEGEEVPNKMPQIVIIIDELADLMMVAPGEVEDAICRLAQLARAAGIHLVIATQRPSVNVITGLIKANVPSRIAFSVSSGVDSRTIIDMNGAEKLLGKGDMLFFPSGYPKPVRVQGAFVSDEEVGKVVEFLKTHMQKEVTYNEEITNTITSTQTQETKAAEEERDPYFAEAGRFIIEKEKGSIGMLQRFYKIGFNRAGRIMDQLADAGVVGPEVGTKPRKVEMTLEEFEEYLRKTS